MASNLETVMIPSPEEDEKFCRICFEPESNGGSLGSYCRCGGTVGLIHGHCLVRWLETSQRTTCELCLERFMVPRAQKVSDEEAAFKVEPSIFDQPGELAIWLMAHLLTTVIFMCMAVESGMRAAVEFRSSSHTASVALIVKVSLALLLLMVSFLILYKGAWRAYVVCWVAISGSRTGQENSLLY